MLPSLGTAALKIRGGRCGGLVVVGVVWGVVDEVEGCVIVGGGVWFVGTREVSSFGRGVAAELLTIRDVVFAEELCVAEDITLFEAMLVTADYAFGGAGGFWRSVEFVDGCAVGVVEFTVVVCVRNGDGVEFGLEGVSIGWCWSSVFMICGVVIV